VEGANEDVCFDEFTTDLKLLDSSGFMRKRNIRKIIRFRHYGKMEDPHNYYREKLMLFVPWRDEEAELLDPDIDIMQRIEVSEHLIHENSKPFYYDADVNDESLTNIVNEIQDNLDITEEENHVVQNDMELMQEGTFCEMNFDENITTGNVRVEQFLPPRAIPDDVYRGLMRTLNEKQRRFVLNSLHLLKTNAAPFYYFLSGGAGVGKSHAVTAIVQSYMRYCGKIADINPEHFCVLVAAPTGKAAFNVFGMTLHSTFKLPPTQYNGKLCDLDEGALSGVRKNLIGVKLFIIDEISMVSVKMLYEVDQRLRQIYATSEDFGGRSIIVVRILLNVDCNSKKIKNHSIHVNLFSFLGWTFEAVTTCRWSFRFSTT
jgi:hypothetical protein